MWRPCVYTVFDIEICFGRYNRLHFAQVFSYPVSTKLIWTNGLYQFDDCIISNEASKSNGLNWRKCVYMKSRYLVIFVHNGHQNYRQFSFRNKYILGNGLLIDESKTLIFKYLKYTQHLELKFIRVFKKYT